ncbi:unnamed protein product [Rhizophagus irregularis]|nr:unnamed protein product [Rhizophagus irregularis]
MIGALQELPNTFHVICIYHLSQNLPKQLKSILGKDYSKFLNDFYTACNSISEDIFEYQWKRLQAKYLQAENYLTNTLYKTKIFNGQIHYSQPHIVATVFSEVSKDLNQWLSPALYEKHKKQICEVTAYRAQITDLTDILATEINENDLSCQVNNNNENPNNTDNEILATMIMKTQHQFCRR